MVAERQFPDKIVGRASGFFPGALLAAAGRVGRRSRADRLSARPLHRTLLRRPGSGNGTAGGPAGAEHVGWDIQDQCGSNHLRVSAKALQCAGGVRESSRAMRIPLPAVGARTQVEQLREIDWRGASRGEKCYLPGVPRMTYSAGPFSYFSVCRSRRRSSTRTLDTT